MFILIKFFQEPWKKFKNPTFRFLGFEWKERIWQFLHWFFLLLKLPESLNQWLQVFMNKFAKRTMTFLVV